MERLARPCTPNDYAVAIAEYFNRDVTMQDGMGMLFIVILLIMVIYLAVRKS